MLCFTWENCCPPSRNYKLKPFIGFLPGEHEPSRRKIFHMSTWKFYFVRAILCQNEHLYTPLPARSGRRMKKQGNIPCALYSRGSSGQQVGSTAPRLQSPSGLVWERTGGWSNGEKSSTCSPDQGSPSKEQGRSLPCWVLHGWHFKSAGLGTMVGKAFLAFLPSFEIPTSTVKLCSATKISKMGQGVGTGTGKVFPTTVPGPVSFKCH